MSGFQVVMSDLQDAAVTFHSEARTFLAIMPNACPVLPDGGSGAFSESLRAVVDAACLLHLQIGGDIDNNGAKLQTAHDRYQHTEESLTTLAQQIGSQLLGLGFQRYVLRSGPLATAAPSQIAAWAWPTIDRYLHAPLVPSHADGAEPTAGAPADRRG